jgi:hypothetical protein
VDAFFFLILLPFLKTGSNILINWCSGQLASQIAWKTKHGGLFFRKALDGG